MKQPIKLEAGKKYITRSGLTVTLEQSAAVPKFLKSEYGYMYNPLNKENGNFIWEDRGISVNHGQDIIDYAPEKEEL